MQRPQDITRGVWRGDHRRWALCETAQFGSLKMSSTPTGKDGDRVWTVQARDSMRESKRCAVSLGTPRNPAGMECRLCVSVKSKVKLERTPGLATIYSSSMRNSSNYNGNGRFRPMLEQKCQACCTRNKARWFSITS